MNKAPDWSSFCGWLSPSAENSTLRLAGSKHRGTQTGFLNSVDCSHGCCLLTEMGYSVLAFCGVFSERNFARASFAPEISAVRARTVAMFQEVLSCCLQARYIPFHER
jgi:hypothetical protein